MTILLEYQSVPLMYAVQCDGHPFPNAFACGLGAHWEALIMYYGRSAVLTSPGRVPFTMLAVLSTSEISMRPFSPPGKNIALPSLERKQLAIA